MKIFISMPMNGLEDEVVQGRINCVKDELYKRYGRDITFADSLFTRNPPIGIREPRLWYLGHSLLVMADCDYICFSFGWENAKGCQIEYETAIRYDIKRIFV